MSPRKTIFVANNCNNCTHAAATIQEPGSTVVHVYVEFVYYGC